MHAAGDFVVYPCEGCGKRIFTERSHVGQPGKCPVCGADHVIGGRPATAAQPGVERRDAARVPAPGAQVAVDPARGAPQLNAVGDLSESGISFVMPALRDPTTIAGFRAPDVKLGDVMRFALHTPELFRPRTFKAEVKRIVPSKDKRAYTLGLHFVGLTQDQKAELRAVVRRLGGTVEE
jgi:hypothetical protein